MIVEAGGTLSAAPIPSGPRTPSRSGVRNEKENTMTDTEHDAGAGATAELMGAYRSKVYDPAGRLVSPHCDVCNRVVRVDDGEKWTMVVDPARATWENNTGAVCPTCVVAHYPQ